MHPLGQLITDRMEVQKPRWSLQDVIDRMNLAGHYVMKKSRLNQIRHDEVKSLDKEAIFAIADGISVTPLTVGNAALESMGISTRAVEVTDSLATIAIDPSLSEQDRQSATALIRQMRSQSQSQWQSAHTTTEALNGGPSDQAVPTRGAPSSPSMSTQTILARTEVARWF